MRPLILLLLAIPVALPAQVPAPSLRTTTSEVLLDFVVRDKNARIIHDLRPDEVRVFEEGVPQKLRHFEFVDGHEATEAPSAQAQIPPTVESSAATAAVPRSLKELRDISVVSIVIANLDPRGRKLAMETMRNFIADQMRPNTYIGVFALGFGTFRVVQPYTNDAERISTAMNRVAGAAMLGQLTSSSQVSLPDTDFGSALNTGAGTAGDPNGPGGPSSPMTFGAGSTTAMLTQLMDTSWINEMHDVYADSRNYLTPLHDFIQSQANIPGRKVVLLFSAGLPIHSDTIEPLKAVISAANRSNVSIYAVDTLGFTEQSNLDNARRILKAATQASMQQQLSKINGTGEIVTPTEVFSLEMGEDSIHANTMGNMSELTDGTGGELLPASLDLRDPLRRVMEDVRKHYELSYSPTNSTMDGSFRKIELKVSRPGARVFTRRGYYAVPVLNGHEIYPFELATLKALNSKPQQHQFDFRTSTLQFRSEPERSQLEFVFQTPMRGLTIVKEGQWVKIHVCVTALIKNEQGQVEEKISKDIPYKVPAAKAAELQQGVVSFSAPFWLAPGRYTLETAAVDRSSMRASVSRSALEVNEDSGFSMSDLTVARRVDLIQGPANVTDPLQSRGGVITPELADNVSPDAGGNLKFYAVAYPPAPVDEPIDVSIEIWRDRQLVMRSPASEVPPDATGAASILANVQTRKLPPGHYQAQVLFEYKRQKVEKSITFTLAAGS